MAVYVVLALELATFITLHLVTHIEKKIYKKK